MPRFPAVIWAACAIAAVAAGIILVIIGDGAAGAYWIAIGFCGTLITAVYLQRARRQRLELIRDGEESSESPEHRTSEGRSASMADSGARRWVGAGTMPSSLGYMQATIPLAVMELSGRRLVVRLRPRLLGKITGTNSLEIEPASGVTVLPVRSNWTWQGMEIRVQGRQSYYFWTRKRAEIMAALAAAGFDISSEEAQMRSR